MLLFNIKEDTWWVFQHCKVPGNGIGWKSTISFKILTQIYVLS